MFFTISDVETASFQVTSAPVIEPLVNLSVREADFLGEVLKSLLVPDLVSAEFLLQPNLLILSFRLVRLSAPPLKGLDRSLASVGVLWLHGELGSVLSINGRTDFTLAHFGVPARSRVCILHNRKVAP